MQCDEARAQFGEIHDGTAATAAREHLAECAACRDAFAAQAAVRTDVRALSTRGKFASPQFSDRVMRAVAADGAATPPGRSWWLAGMITMAAVAAVLLLYFRHTAPLALTQTENAAVATHASWRLHAIITSENIPVALLETPGDGLLVAVRDGDTVAGMQLRVCDDKRIELRQGSLSLSLPIAGKISLPWDTLQQKLRGGSCSADEFKAIRSAAWSGEPEAITLLALIADTPSPLASDAAELLGGEKRRVLDGLIRASLDRNNSARLDTIRALGRHATPPVLLALRTIARADTVAARLLAIQGLATAQDAYAIPLLEELSRLDDRDIGNAAAAALHTILPPR